MRPFARLILALFVAVSFIAPSLAETSPEAMKWLTGMASLYEKGPYKMNYDMSLKMQQMGQTFGLEATGNMTQHGQRKMRMVMNMTSPAAAVPGPFCGIVGNRHSRCP